MVYKMFSVYDTKAEAYMRPFVAQSTGAAIRSFSDEVNTGDKQSPLANHPEDFVLFEIAAWDEMTGVISVYEARKALGAGIDFKRDPNPAVRAV